MKPKPIVYLAGLISTDYAESLSWRITAEDWLCHAFDVLTPLRGKPLDVATKDGGITTTVASSRSIVLRDREDVRRSNVILAHLSTFGSPRPLVGTVVELGWAWEDRKPVVAIADKDDYLMRNHPFISQFVSEYVTSLEGAVDFLKRYHA